MSETTLIRITRSPQGTGVFPPVECTASQLVFWRNDDPTSPHWPIFPDQPGVGPRFQTGSGDTSDPVQPYAGPAIVPPASVVVSYGCHISNHEAEQGTITVWADFLVNSSINGGNYTQLPDGAVNVAYPAQVLTVGGKPKYRHTLTDASLPAGLTVTDADAGVTISGKPTQAGNNFAFTVHCLDALGNKVDQTFTLSVAAAATVTT